MQMRMQMQKNGNAREKSIFLCNLILILLH